MAVLLVNLDPAAGLPVAAAQTGQVGLAQPPPTPTPDPSRGEEYGKASPVALVVILLLGVALALLIRSMNKHLRRVPKSFDPPSPGEPPRDDAGRAGEQPS